MHATYQALKTTTEHLYTEIRTKEQEMTVSRVRPALDAALKSLEDCLGITQAEQEGLKRKQEEDMPVVEAKIGRPRILTQSPGDIAAAVTNKVLSQARTDQVV